MGHFAFICVKCQTQNSTDIRITWKYVCDIFEIINVGTLRVPHS